MKKYGVWMKFKLQIRTLIWKPPKKGVQELPGVLFTGCTIST